MKTAKGIGNDRILYGVLGIFALGSCLYIYEEVFAGGSSSPATPAAVVSSPAQPARAAAAGGPAKVVGTTSAGLDPTLHMEAMLVSERVEYSGSGRNVFSTNSAPPVDIQKPVAPARVVAQAVIPCPPNCPQPVVRPPDPIELKFFGVETSSNGVRRALLLHNDTVYVASAGEIVLRRYRLITVDAKSIQVEDMQNNNKQTLPLLVN